MLELDHVFCVLADPAPVVRRIEGDGWRLDAGQEHRGQGTRNRRLVFREQFLELIWVTDVDEARANPLRFDRRAQWARTGHSPFGIGFRGQLTPQMRDRFWLHDALGIRLWISRDHQEAPERPLVFVLESSTEQLRLRREQLAATAAHGRRSAGLVEVLFEGPNAPSLPSYVGPRIWHGSGAHRLSVITDPAGLLKVLQPE